ncbi:hypothetical protein [Aureibacter tunicatorum]|uniref:Uncharacterized protein n=1 Tax=Aureibacter tunicatorum TaxID=866807 RepID=A0AAE4BNZ9_9BACT|nr:hypothetical protein [Aureibacter tunicatorum]MDR6237384.1 hypothetical protein [Aureibacter tunicatorum]BDD06374.1 hypothetical protein AUTU_38570 [Aureibacter tunicatorum]
MDQRKRKKWILLLPMIGMLAIMAISCDKGGNTYVSSTPGKKTNGLAWLDQNPIPEPNYATFPEGYTLESGEVTNEAFHEVSWNYFLWLTEEVTLPSGEKALRFDSMYNDQAIVPTISNPTSHVLGGVRQAGLNSILVDENRRAVYTTMMINDIYRDFAIKHKLYTPEGLRSIDSDSNFTDGSLSMKASWMIIPEGKKAPQVAYTKRATLYKVVDVNGELTTSDDLPESDSRHNSTVEETVALVGFHIAAVVKDHPEFIWATFEHKDNAPNLILKNETEPSLLAGDVVSDSSYTFYKAGTKVGLCNIANLGALEVDPNTQLISGFYGVDPTTQVYRRYQFGGGSENNQDNIDSLNQIVRAKLAKENSIWQNYYEVGAVWFDLDKGKLEPDWSLTVIDSIQTGSTTLSNATIETFTQNPGQQNSCFSCHNTTRYNPPHGEPIPAKNVLTSHILLKNYNDSVDTKEIIRMIKRSQ